MGGNVSCNLFERLHFRGFNSDGGVRVAERLWQSGLQAFCTPALAQHPPTPPPHTLHSPSYTLHLPHPASGFERRQISRHLSERLHFRGLN